MPTTVCCKFMPWPPCHDDALMAMQLGRMTMHDVSCADMAHAGRNVYSADAVSCILMCLLLSMLMTC
jgi:hypothetical protein